MFCQLVTGCKYGSTGLVKQGELGVSEKVSNNKETTPTTASAEKSGGGQIENSTKSSRQPHEQIDRKDSPAVESSPGRSVSAEKTHSAGTRSSKSYNGRGGGEGESEKKPSEQELVKRASLEIAKGIETVKKIRICHFKNQDEWWVTLYDDLGAIIDLKQYVWDRDTETLRPFLVLKRISKNRLESELNSKTPDQTCENLDPPVKSSEKK